MGGSSGIMVVTYFLATEEFKKVVTMTTMDVAL